METLYKTLRPMGELPFHREPFEQYKNRVGQLFPNIPECVLEQWVYRHYDQFIPEYASFLNIKDISFEKEARQKDWIYNEIKSFDEGWIDGRGHHFYQGYSFPLKEYMLKHRTWPVPIIVIENREGKLKNSSGWPLGEPFHLAEGHTRLNFFRENYRLEKETLKETHEIWVIRP
jgi:hypothetical protein